MLLLGLHSAGRHCITALDSGSLFSLIAYLLVMRSTWCLRGGWRPLLQGQQLGWS